MIEFKHTKTDTKGYFSAVVDGKEAGKIYYSLTGETGLIISHTEVPKYFSGQSIGKKLVMQVVEFARENNLKILPLCPFAKSIFEKNPSIRDVLINP